LALAADPVWQVRRAAAGVLSAGLAAVGAELMLDGRAEVRAALASNPRCGPYWIGELLGDDSAPVRAAAAAGPNATPEQLRAAASDGERAVRRAVARNPRTPSEAQMMLASDPDPAVVESVARWTTDASLIRELASG
jgi:hypothetical protein